jgi:hypothetical protein
MIMSRVHTTLQLTASGQLHQATEPIGLHWRGILQKCEGLQHASNSHLLFFSIPAIHIYSLSSATCWTVSVKEGCVHWLGMACLCLCY